MTEETHTKMTVKVVGRRLAECVVYHSAETPIKEVLTIAADAIERLIANG